MNIAKFLRTAFFIEHFRLLLLEREAFMVRVTIKEKNNKKFLIVYSHLRFSITKLSLKLINTNSYGKETEKTRKHWNKKRGFNHKIFGGVGVQ